MANPIKNISKHRLLTRKWKYTLIVFYLTGLILVINQVFRLELFGFLPIDTSYFYYLFVLFFSPLFILFPSSKKTIENVPWYDILLFVFTIGISLYFGIKGMEILSSGWEWQAPLLPTVLSFYLWAVSIEAVRRVAGYTLGIICLVFSFLPLYTSYLPWFLRGQPLDLDVVARAYVMGREALIGIPFTAFATLMIGFMILGSLLVSTGGGDFLFRVSDGLMGRFRGGPAKVAVVSSAAFGSLSGGPVANVITTGSMTIPAMKRTGYANHYAGAIEATASTGGVLMPPIMGAAAFVMASFLGVNYLTIVICAIIPSILYYLGLLVQVDAYAARNNIRGSSVEERKNKPRVWKTLISGWYFLVVIFVLFYILVEMRIEVLAPFYASALLLILAFIGNRKLFNKGFLAKLVYDTGNVLVELVAIVAGIGLIVGSLSITGVAFSFSSEIVSLAGESVLFILIFGALTSFILGMGMTTTAVYIFLAVVLAPSLIQLGIEPLAAHFFILYWGVISYITPPVALASYAASSIAGANPNKTGLHSMKLGIVLYFIPFLFVYNPSLLAIGSFGEILSATITAIVGITILAYALEGYMPFIGNLNIVLRALFIAGGIMITIPEQNTDFIGLIVLILAIAWGRIRRRGQIKEVSQPAEFTENHP